MTALYQRQVDARLDHHRRFLQAHTVSDALTQVIGALADAVSHGDSQPEVWRLAAMRTSQLLAMLNVGAASLGEPLPPVSVELIQQLRIWALTMGAEAVHASNQTHRCAGAAVQRSGPDLPPSRRPERGTPGGRANVAAGPALWAIPSPPAPTAEPPVGARWTRRPPKRLSP